MQQSSEIDPEQTANQIMEKSFLKSRGMDIVMQEAKRDTGSEFFRDNKIRSCSFVKETENCLKAYPFYDKRNQTIYPTPSALRNSWTATVHSNTRHYHAGMGNNKTLVKVISH